MGKYGISVILGLVMVLGACGSDDSSSEEGSNENGSAEEVETAEVSEDPTEKSIDDSQTEASDESTAQEAGGTVEIQTDGSMEPTVLNEDDELKFTGIYMDDQVNFTGDMGPIQYDITNVDLATFEFKTEAAAASLGRTMEDELQVIGITMNFENTSDNDFTFDTSTMTATTNTNEEMVLSPMMSDTIPSEFPSGHTQQNVAFAFVFEDSTVEELETIEVNVAPPVNQDGEVMGEDTTLKILIDQ